MTDLCAFNHTRRESPTHISGKQTTGPPREWTHARHGRQSGNLENKLAHKCSLLKSSAQVLYTLLVHDGSR